VPIFGAYIQAAFQTLDLDLFETKKQALQLHATYATGDVRYTVEAARQLIFRGSFTKWTFQDDRGINFLIFKIITVSKT